MAALLFKRALRGSFVWVCLGLVALAVISSARPLEERRKPGDQHSVADVRPWVDLPLEDGVAATAGLPAASHTEHQRQLHQEEPPADDQDDGDDDDEQEDGNPPPEDDDDDQEDGTPPPGDGGSLEPAKKKRRQRRACFIDGFKLPKDTIIILPNGTSFIIEEGVPVPFNSTSTTGSDCRGGGGRRG